MNASGAGAPSRLSAWPGRALPVVSMLVFTLLGALIPVLRTPGFYFWDDTAAAAAGVWQRIARSVLSGEMPFLQLDTWHGGNLAAEAATGMWNPVMVGLMLLTYPIDNLAVSMAVARIILFLITAGGVYLLARSYLANPWLAAAVGAAYPLSGWSLFLDGTAWINGTALTAMVPWAWWAVRRTALSNFRPLSLVIAVAVGYLVPSTGNPYGVIAIAVVYVAVGAELLFRHRRSDIPWLAGVGAATALLVAVAYLPFLMTSRYGVRSVSGLWNDEFLSVSVSDLLGMSMPTHHPYIAMWSGAPMGLPGAYLAWFVIPLLPWIRWGQVRVRLAELSGVLVFAAVYLPLVLGPSQIWLFRWPARLLPVFYLPLVVFVAAVVSPGLARQGQRIRSLVSLALILLGGWLAFADVPSAWKWHLLVTAGVVVGTVLVIRWAGVGWRGFVVMAVGTVLGVGAQVALQPINPNLYDYQLPTSRQEMVANGQRHSSGLVVQIFDMGKLMSDYPANRRWSGVLAGNMPSVAGVESTSSYSGIGFTKFDSALCLTYSGATCPEAWARLWQVPKGADRPLADLIRAEYVVVMNGYVPDLQVPSGWVESEKTDVVTTYQRSAPIVNPAGTISAWGKGVWLSADARVGAVSEAGTVSTGDGDTTVTFARIAWPGYSLRVAGQPVRTAIGPAGLLTARLPTGLKDARFELDFRPPGLRLGLALAGLGGLLLVIVVGLAVRRQRRSGKPKARLASREAHLRIEGDPGQQLPEDGQLQVDRNSAGAHLGHGGGGED